MGLLDDFKIVDVINGAPTMSITRNGVSFNKTTIEKLAFPENVILLIDEPSKRLAITPCDKTQRGARAFFKPGRDSASGVRWNNYDLKSTIENMMSWDLSTQAWRVTGLFSAEDNALIFDLSQAEDNSKISSRP